MKIKFIDIETVVTDRKSAIKAMDGFLSQHGVDGIECPSGFKGFEVEAVHLYKRIGKFDIPGKSGKIYGFIRLGKERIPIRGYIMDGVFAALVTPAVFAFGPKREPQLKARNRIMSVLRAFRAHFVEWDRDSDMALMFRVMEGCLDTLNHCQKTKRITKGG